MMRYAAICCAILLLFAWAVPARAQNLNYQGQLTELIDFGDDWEFWNPVRETEVSMVFRLYTTATGGTACWTETQTVTTDYQGIYNVHLGSVTPLTIADAGPYWLGVTVDDNAEMTPRLSLGSVTPLEIVGGYVQLIPHSSAPDICTSVNAGTLALTSNYTLCACNGQSWRAVGYGTACKW